MCAVLTIDKTWMSPRVPVAMDELEKLRRAAEGSTVDLGEPGSKGDHPATVGALP